MVGLDIDKGIGSRHDILPVNKLGPANVVTRNDREWNYQGKNRKDQRITRGLMWTTTVNSVQPLSPKRMRRDASDDKEEYITCCM